MLATTIHESNTTHPTTKDGATTTHPPPRGRNHSQFPQLQRPKKYGTEVAGLLSQSPIVCLMIPSPAKPRADKNVCCAPNRATHYRRRRSSPNHRVPHGCGGGGTILVLLRKEVIQPHLPVRLPCYDLVPIASPTFDGSLLAVGPPASGITDFRDLTGGVYKARERIHRSMLTCDY